MGKKRGKYPAHQIARKKYSWWPEITAPSPPPAQELNGRPLSEERKITPGVLEKQRLWCFVSQFVELIVTDFKVET